MKSFHRITAISRRIFFRHIYTRADKNDEVVTQYVGKNRKPTPLVFVWGYAGTGALGLPELIAQHESRFPIMRVREPVILPWANKLNSNRINIVACGVGFTIFGSSHTKVSNLFGTGLNTSSQLGYIKKNKMQGDHECVVSPVAINLPLEKQQRITKLSAGRAHTLILTDVNGVISLGNNAYGQCGRPIVEGECFESSRTVNFLSNELPSDVCDVICGLDHSLFLCSSGHVYGCGWNSDCQLGLNHCDPVGYPEKIRGDIENERIVKIACKGDFAIALNDKGDVFGWGNNEYNQILTDNKDVQVTYPIHFPLNFKVKDIAASGTISLVLSESNDLYAWGFGSLGSENNVVNAAKPVLIPRTQFLFADDDDTFIESITSGLKCLAAITNKKDLYMWGTNQYGNLGVGKRTFVDTPVKVSIAAKVDSVHCGLDHTVALCKSFI